MTIVTMPELSFGARGKTTLGKDSSDFDLHPGFLLGLEDGGRLQQENGKFIVLEWGVRCVYREKPTSKGRLTVRQRYVISENPQSTPQQENRKKFGDGVAAWQVLTSTEQIVWNKLRYPEHIAGYNRYLRAYMRGEI